MQIVVDIAFFGASRGNKVTQEAGPSSSSFPALRVEGY